MGRDDAAAALGISRELAAFHLDRLVEGGLLETEYRRLTGRTGPGAGRPAKLYRRVAGDVAVSLPPRDVRACRGGLRRCTSSASRPVTASTPPGPSPRSRGNAAWRPPARPAVPRARLPPRTAARSLLDLLRSAGFEPQVDPADGADPAAQLPLPAAVRAAAGADLRDEPGLGLGHPRRPRRARLRASRSSRNRAAAASSSEPPLIKSPTRSQGARRHARPARVRRRTRRGTG